MSPASGQRRTRTSGANGNTDGLIVGALAVLVLVGVGSVTAAVHLGNQLTPVPVGSPQTNLPTNPFDLAAGLIGGDVAWPPAATWLLVAGGVLLLLLAITVTVLVLRWRRRRSRVDAAARHMGRGKDLAALTARGAQEKATRLGVATPGLPIAATVATGQTLYSSWEDVCVDVWGPRTGKSTSRAIPAIMAAPGAVLATSNKRDLVDATRDPRAAVGRVWIFDPQSIADEPATWWWNPLSYVTDEVKAGQLARLFATAAREPGAKTDAYFDKAGTSLLANLLLAAALADRPITQVYLWLTDPTEDEPVHILTEHDYPLSAAALKGTIDAPEKQRAGVYGTAQETVSFLTNRSATTWVTPQGPPGTDRRPQFVPADFVRSADTLHSLSKEGEGSTGPLVTALTVAVTEAAENLARVSPQGRLPVPLVAVLDEAANVCRWHNLPDLYSHYGSRGIMILTILQSWSQGVEVWGRDGMRKLWSAANVKVYGGGVSETEFLTELSTLIGEADVDTVSTSRSRGHTTTSRSLRRDRVLDVSDLGAMPRFRAVVFASGVPPVLVRTLPWMDSPAAPAIQASIEAHDPSRRHAPPVVAAARGLGPA